MAVEKSSNLVSRRLCFAAAGFLLLGIAIGKGIGRKREESSIEEVPSVSSAPADGEKAEPTTATDSIASKVPNSSPVWSFDDKVTADETVVIKDEKEIYHIFLRGREEKAGHTMRPLPWDCVAAGEDFSIPLADAPDEPGGEFSFWFGSVSRRNLDHEIVTSWFKNSGEEIGFEEAAVLSEDHGVDIARWRLVADEDELVVNLVGGFEGVRCGFIARHAQIFVPGAETPLVAQDLFGGEAEKPRHWTNVKIPGGSFEDFLMTVDLAWGDQTASFDPVLGAKATIGGLNSQVVFLQPFAKAAGGMKRGEFAVCFGSQQLRVEATTAGFFFSDPAFAYFMYPEMISRSGRSEIRYFLPPGYGNGPDIRMTSMPIAMSELERIVLHYRHRRCRAVFALEDLPVPEI